MMKKRIIYLVISIFLPLLAYNQQFQGGLVGGIIGSQVAGDLYSGYNKVGVLAGAYISLQLAPQYFLQLEMEYIQKGSRHNFDADFPNEPAYKMNLAYIEMPLLVEYKVNDKLGLEAGIGSGVLVSHKEFQDGQEMVNRPGFKSLDLSAIAGINYTFDEHYKVNLRTDNSMGTIRSGVVAGSVRRIGNKWGQYNDILAISLFYRL